jgi:hypothetical protein
VPGRPVRPERQDDVIRKIPTKDTGNPQADAYNRIAENFAPGGEPLKEDSGLPKSQPDATVNTTQILPVESSALTPCS